mgnify:CR=1 FL=1
MFKRFGLFMLVNFAVMFMANIVLNLLGVHHYLTPMGINYESLMAFCFVYGMCGAFFSLMISKQVAKWTMGLRVLEVNSHLPAERRLVEMVHGLSRKAKLPKMPEVALYDSPDPNAFATGPSKSNSLVAVSSGLLQTMNQDEVEGVLAHEVSHIANGDMVTMTLLQGVINAFVMFFAKAASWAVANFMKGDDEESSPSFFLVFALEMAFYVVFGLIGGLIVSWFSRQREFKADLGAAHLSGAQKMRAALQRLTQVSGDLVPERADSFASLKISSKKSWLELLSTHPPLEERIARLENPTIRQA